MKKLNLEHIIGIDIAGDEGKYPLDLHERALKLAKKEKINITCHAGEWNESFNTIENLKLASEIGVNRIGHAT